MATVHTSIWRLKRFGRFLPGTKEDGGNPWKMFEPSESAGELVLTIVESGHMLVSQGHCLLCIFQDGFSLLDAPSFLKVQQKSDTLLFRLTVKGESRLMRMQFSGSSRAEALEECGSAVLRLKEYLPVTTQGGPPPPPLSCPPTSNQPPTKTTAQDQQAGAGEAMATEPEVVQGSLSIKRLTQHFLGEYGLSLPLVYRHSALSRGELEPFLRLCLLDPSFPALVEEVEGELKRVLQD
ncbi:meiotic recombination protein REC114-like isoform X1 [Coregonus clupeaformis]|uniref:meiotic recombination protein REC114-like isoform X1 n=1 Tax=Coregonus clupeaformis TaxID=59861 RepID=UPI001BE0ACDB|nr:meiotic recombination protein REC114-like isoform X1 [Coregonus clupeaformis]